jgi:hypothetical protein
VTSIWSSVRARRSGWAGVDSCWMASAGSGGRGRADARLPAGKGGAHHRSAAAALRHQHPDDGQPAAAVLERLLQGEPFGGRHRIIDTAGRTHWAVFVGERMLEDAGAVIGSSGFYVDVTESLQSDITTAGTEIVVSRARIEQAKGVLMARMASPPTGRSTSWSGVRKKPTPSP